MELTFLKAAVPLTKVISKVKDEIVKNPYPMVGKFTSNTVEINSVLEFHKEIEAHAKKGYCLLKGLIGRTLNEDSRRGATSTSEATEWMCLDFDRLPGNSVQEIMVQLGLDDVSHVIQYSSSAGLTKGTISAHVFIMLEKPIAAPSLKSWLMEQNLKHFEVQLSRTNSALTWPLDVTVCQNDKLIYIAPPKFVGMEDPVKGARIQFHRGPVEKLPLDRLPLKPLEAIKREARNRLNELREFAGLSALRSKTTIQGEYEIQNKPDECVVTSIRNDGEFVRLNLNGGDSWAYWHPVNNFDLIHDFKTGVSFKTKELIPGYYMDQKQSLDIARSTPSESGDLVLGFCDIPTAAYKKGLWNPVNQDLKLWPARSERQVNDWYQSHGIVPPDYIPQWTIYFNPRSDEIVNTEEKNINMYKKSPYFDVDPDPKSKFPAIKAAIQHVLNDNGEVYEHFINWFACIFQRKHKPLTAWVMHGAEGTGKGFFFNKIASPLLHRSNCYSALVGDLEDKYNDWIENKSLILIDEVDINDFKEKGKVTAKLRNYITEPFISVRAMQVSSEQVENWSSWIFSSNKLQPVFIPETDRRYNVGNYQSVKLIQPNEELIESELEAFAAYLKAHSADIALSNTIIKTQAREDIAKMGITGARETARALLEGDWEELMLMAPSDDMAPGLGQYAMVYKQLIKRIIDEDKLTRDELFIIFEYTVGKVPSSPNKLTSYLKHQGITTRRIRKNNVNTYGIDVKWKKK